MKHFLKLWLFFLLMIWNSHSWALNQCTQAVYQLSQEMNIPKDILMAVALTETGMSIDGEPKAPRPWVVNIEGKGITFKNKQQAIRATRTYLALGKSSIDIGCMQMNWRWHKQRFDQSLRKAFDPYQNVKQAAEFIYDNYLQLGNWTKAVGKYHSATHKYAVKYIRKFKENLKIVKSTAQKPQLLASLSMPESMPEPNENVNIMTGGPMINHTTGAIIELEEKKQDHKFKKAKTMNLLPESII